MIYLQLFWVFFKTGLFSFGGGYAMLPMLRHDIVETRGWMGLSEFTDLVALSQMTPGPISVNCATFVGYSTTGNFFGALLASFALCLPSVGIIWGIIAVLKKYARMPLFQSVLNNMRPVTAGLIASAGIMLMNPQNFADYKGILICIGTFCLAFFRKTNPLILLVLSGFAGFLLW